MFSASAISQNWKRHFTNEFWGENVLNNVQQTQENLQNKISLEDTVTEIIYQCSAEWTSHSNNIINSN